jgi:glycosyltransferase involved in cell wall biosynthesis
VDELVSVVVLTFNSRRHIRRCLDALLAQSHQPVEVIVVDGGSTDDTEAIVRTYENRLLVRFIEAPGTNMGQARNVGIEHSRGQFIAFCDSDDFYEPAKLHIGLEVLRAHPDADVSYAVATHFRSDGDGSHYLARRLRPVHGSLANEIVKAQTVNINTLLVRRSRMGHVRFPDDAGGRYGEDWQYLVNLVVEGALFRFVHGQYSMIEVRTDSHTSWKIQHLMKWYVTRHLVLHRAALRRQGVSAWRWHTSLTRHWLKFSLACVASEDPEFSRKAPFHEIGGRPFVVLAFFVLLMPLARSRIFSKIVRNAWETNRRLKERRVTGRLER